MASLGIRWTRLIISAPSHTGSARLRIHVGSGQFSDIFLVGLTLLLDDVTGALVDDEESDEDLLLLTGVEELTVDETLLELLETGVEDELADEVLLLLTIVLDEELFGMLELELITIVLLELELYGFDDVELEETLVDDELMIDEDVVCHGQPPFPPHPPPHPRPWLSPHPLPP